ncbi:MAG: DUF3137 domain-containing protein [Ekhidna sp.]
MESTSSLKQLFIELETERQEILVKEKKPRLIGTIICICSIPIFIFTETFIGFIVLSVGGFFLIIAHTLQQPFVKKFKSTVIGQLVKLISPDLEYDPKGGFDISYLHDAGLVRERPTICKSEDRIYGKVGATDIDLCEHRLQKKVTTTDSKGNRKTKIVTLFSGLVVSADFHKNFNGTMLIVPDTADSASWKWAAKQLEIKSKGDQKIVRLEDPEFEKTYTVYATDQIEARYILSPSFMQRMVKMHQKLNNKAKASISISFRNDRMIMAIHWQNNFFEYTFHKSVEEEVKETLEELKLCTDIVDELNLNTRIWSKQ